jgi:gliding motility-associated lipoprotein GldD
MKELKGIALYAGLLCCISLVLGSCQEVSFTPKPRAYPKIEYPQRSYVPFDEDYCSFSFQYPAYVEVQKDSVFFDEAPLHSCWFDLYYPAFDSRIYFTYYPIGASKSFEELKKDAFELADWHNKKANYIDEYLIDRPEQKVHGFAFNIDGPAASPFQFYLTDSTHHFLRGSIYFNTKTQTDSLAPLIAFVKEDALKIIETLEWKEE